jgi:large subunit ribosomal protein L19
MMLRSLASSFYRRNALHVGLPSIASAVSISVLSTTKEWDPVAPEDMPYLHHGKRPRYRAYEKFKSPRRCASKIYDVLMKEAIDKSKVARPKVWDTQFEVGDAIEIENVEEGGVNAKSTEKIRGVVLGIFRKRLDHSILIRDVVFGEPVETRVPLHSPLLRSIKVLEMNFVHKGKKKVKWAKLYYLSERNPLGTLQRFLFNRLTGSFITDFFLLFPFFIILLTETQVTKW